jgi:hypothetical protein
MRHRVRARPLLTSVCTVCALALPSSALASGSSPVHVDPSSPVAKEYALPLATARGAAPESGQSGKLFGSGIKHASSSTTQTTTAPATPQTVQPAAPTATTTTPPPTSTPPPATTAPPTATRPAHHPPPHVTTVTLPALTRTVTAKPLAAKATPAAYRVLKPGSGSGLLWMLLAAVLVLALGSAGGLALSRRR